MSMLKNLKNKIPEVDEVIKDFIDNPCCGEDEEQAKDD